MHKLPEHLQLTIESICEAGCDHVNQTIKQLQQHHVTDDTHQLNSEEREKVLVVLKNIMSVYEQK